MKYYNLYYKDEKFNTVPLSEKDLIDLVNSTHKGIIYKRNNKDLVPVQIKNIQLVECTII